MRLRPLPPILINIIHTALLACEGARFHAGDTCPRCGGTLHGYDERHKRFAILIEDGKETVVRVIIRRSWCRACRTIINPPEPFYPGTRIGAPVVDLCRALAHTMPCGRVSTRLVQMGVEVDRWSVQSYKRLPLPPPPTITAFGMAIPVPIISLSTLAGSAQGTDPLDMDTILEVCRYPDRRTDGPASSGP